MSEVDPKACKLDAINQVGAGQDGPRLASAPRLLVFALVTGAYLLGGAGMLAWLLFLVLGLLPGADLSLSTVGSLLVDSLLCLLFFFQHSLMVRRGFRVWLARAIRADLHGVLYATVSGGFLLLLVFLWQPSGITIWTPPPLFRWAMFAIIVIAGMLGWLGARALGELDMLGIRPALGAMANGQGRENHTFSIRGPYRWVRHPLYLVSLVVIWAGPQFTVDRWLHNFLFTIWIVIGARLEERDLAACFGKAYQRYQQTVPMLLPTSVKPVVPAGHGEFDHQD